MSIETFPGLSIQAKGDLFFVAFGFREGEHADAEIFRITPYYTGMEGAEAALATKTAEYRASTVGVVRDILARDNVTEASGEWSAYDVARVLDPGAREPGHLFDTGLGTQPAPEFVALAEESIRALGVSGRYVGGTSGHLYHISGQRP